MWIRKRQLKQVESRQEVIVVVSATDDDGLDQN